MDTGYPNAPVATGVAGGDRERRLWQPTRHPVQIETESFWQTKIDYLYYNPVPKGLVRSAEHW